MEALTPLALALFFATVNERIVEVTIAKLFDLIAQPWAKTALMIATWITGGLLSWLAKIDLFTMLAPKMDPLAGLILTAIVVGGGSNLLHTLFDPKKPEQPGYRL